MASVPHKDTSRVQAGVCSWAATPRQLIHSNTAGSRWPLPVHTLTPQPTCRKTLPMSLAISVALMSTCTVRKGRATSEKGAWTHQPSAPHAAFRIHQPCLPWLATSSTGGPLSLHPECPRKGHPPPRFLRGSRAGTVFQAQCPPPAAHTAGGRGSGEKWHRSTRTWGRGPPSLCQVYSRAEPVGRCAWPILASSPHTVTHDVAKMADNPRTA